MAEYRVPGVFIEELAKLPPAVAEVETALPAFIGYTAQATLSRSGDLLGVPHRIRSLVEFEACYGIVASYRVKRVDLDKAGNFVSASLEAIHFMHDALRLFYANGGGDCFIVSVGAFPVAGQASLAALQSGLQAVAAVDAVTLLLCPDAVLLGELERGSWQQAALAQCSERQGRFALFDLAVSDRDGSGFRTHVGSSHLKHGAAYAPWLAIHPGQPASYAQVRDCLFREGVPVRLGELTGDPAVQKLLARLDASLMRGRRDEITRLETALANAFPVYRGLLAGIARMVIQTPPGGAMAGIYARVDRERGVWKAPANVAVNGIAGLAIDYSTEDQAAMNVDASAGKSINLIRRFPGKGWLVWGARTLAGNDNEWRYVSVRRFFNMLETSIRQSMAAFVFEPNDATTWGRLRAMIDNYLTLKWQEGALMGSKPGDAFYVRCALGQTMTDQDIVLGRLVVEMGLAVVRPAEFIILRIELKMLEG